MGVGSRQPTQSAYPGENGAAYEIDKQSTLSRTTCRDDITLYVSWK